MKYTFLAAILLNNLFVFGQQETQPAQPSGAAVSSSSEGSPVEDSFLESPSGGDQQPARLRSAAKQTTCTENNGKPCPEWLHKLIGQYPPVPQGASSLPHAPQPQQSGKTGFWSFRGLNDPVLRTNRQVLHDKTLLATESFWLGSIVYDAELTHQGLAHHKCVEATTLVDDRHPSRGELYAWDVPEFAAGTALNYLMMRFVGKPLIFETAGIASAEHLRGGSKWLMSCW